MISGNIRQRWPRSPIDPVTYWRTFEEHEKSHADATFSTKFEALAKMCTDTRELGYDMLWRGAPEGH